MFAGKGGIEGLLNTGSPDGTAWVPAEVDVSIRPVRQYPYGALASHILGYVGPADTDTEEAKNFTFYQPDVEGKNNVELFEDKWLRGKAGARVIKKNAKGVIEGEIGVKAPVPGDDVYLTIDARILDAPGARRVPAPPTGVEALR